MKEKRQLNFIKTNLSSIILKNYSIQYERILSKRISVAVTFRTMPKTSLPFKKKIADAVGDDEDAKDIINKTQLSNFAFTPEIRLYLNKTGFGRGFYFAPFYRYAKFSTNQIPVNYETNSGSKQSINLGGKLTANTFGAMFGTQRYLSKHVCLDLWMLGAHYGSGNGDFNGIPNVPLSTTEQAEIRDALENIDIPLTNKTVIVTANNVAMKLDGPWAGLRAGISLGFKF
jgi:hypothetical protein